MTQPNLHLENARPVGRRSSEDDRDRDCAARRHARALLEACGHRGPVVASPRFGSPALEWAASGGMWLTGEAQGEPRFAPGALATAMRGAGLALRSLARGRGFEQLDAPALLGERAALSGLSRQGAQSCGGSARLLRARDGFVAANLPRADDWRSLSAWLESDLQDVETQHSWPRIESVLRERDVGDLVQRAHWLGLAVAPAPRLPPREPPLFRLSHASEQAPPAAGRRIRLLDLSTLWAGPLAASLLSESGLEVLKVESPERPDGARAGPRAFFDLMHHRKTGCALDLHRAQDRARFERLLDAADIVLESARPRALEQLGFDAASWLAMRPGRIWASITGYGRNHPGIAFGDDAAVAAGLAWSPAADDEARREPRAEAPVFCGDAIADPLTGLHAAAVILGLLRAGRGGLVDLALVDVAARSTLVTESGWTCALTRGAHGFEVQTQEDRIPVAPPRARPLPRSARAPRLAAPSETLLEHWSGPC